MKCRFIGAIIHTMINKVKISDNDFPGLFGKADYASTRAQKNYLIINTAFLIVLIVVAFVFENFDQREFKFISLSLIFVLLIINITIFYFQFEQKWYEGRAIAESIKTLSWKYMMKSRPFESSLGDAMAEKKFIAYLNSLIGEKKSFFKLVGGKFSSLSQITSKMKDLRSFDYKLRLDIYEVYRLNNQLKWYKQKSELNKSRKTYLLLFNAFLMILILFVIVFDLELIAGIRIKSVLIVIIVSTLAWLHIKRHQELSYSYALTAHELRIIKSKIKNVDSDSKLNDFVDDSETAISREHTMWLARRENL